MKSRLDAAVAQATRSSNRGQKVRSSLKLAAEPGNILGDLRFSSSSVGATSSLLESLRYERGSGPSGTSASDEVNGQAKYGIPRFGGEAAAITEYAFRVRARIAREAVMDKGEVKKQGPLGLRLLEGLRGPAFRLAQQMDMTELASEGGPEKLLNLFEKHLKPRKAQEARELYAAGSKDGGMLARQYGEPMSSYVMRRKAWWHALQQLDDKMQVSESILAEQLLLNSGITEDQRLMVRTILGDVMTVESVAEELMSQHPRISDKESYHGKGDQRFGKSFRRPFRRDGQRAFLADVEEESWDSHSQSLTGFTEEVYDDWTHDESYMAEHDEHEDQDFFLENSLALHLSDGLDLESEEACALAAESLQAEHEAYFIRNQAKNKGFGGFGVQRSFSIKGQLSLQEKQARLQQLKLKTECRKCGQKGH